MTESDYFNLLDENTTLALVKGDVIIRRKGKGVSSAVELINDSVDLNGFIAVDTVVGKALSILFLKLGIKEVYALLISENAYTYLTSHGVKVTYKTITSNILNRDKSDLCPMEKLSLSIDDYDDGYKVIVERFNKMFKNQTM